MQQELSGWEGEGGAIGRPPDVCAIALDLIGTPTRWSGRNASGDRVIADFDRVAKSFHTVAAEQAADKRAGTEAIIDILEDSRAAVMRKEHAGYFIREWQETGDQVRQLLLHDPHYQALKGSPVEILILQFRERLETYEHSTFVRPHRGEAD